MDDELDTYIKTLTVDEKATSIQNLKAYAQIPGEDTIYYGHPAGEDGYDSENYCEEFKRKTSEKELTLWKEEKVEKFRQVLSERQELKRKNIFLNKKMFEFFKRRRMDNVMKEDPKGLDMESKYLKRLYELQSYQKCTREEKELIDRKITVMKKETIELQKKVKKAQEEFLEKQRKVAAILEIKKTGKKISRKAISNFLIQQAMNNEEISKLRYQDIKRKRLLQQRQEVVQTLDNLGQGLRRADYEKLKFEYQIRSKLLEDKTDEVQRLQLNVSAKLNKLTQAQMRDKQFTDIFEDSSQRDKEAGTQCDELQQRLHKLSIMCTSIRNDEKQLHEQSGLLSYMHLIREFEKTLLETEDVWRRLQQAEILYKTRLIYLRGGQVNTPIDFFKYESKLGDG